MPFDRFVSLFHYFIVGLEKTAVFPVLPQIIIRDTPSCFRGAVKGFKPFQLFFTVNVKEKLQNDITAVPKLTFKFVDGADSVFVFVIGYFPADIFPDQVFHPAGIQEHDFSVFRNCAGIWIQKGITAFTFSCDRRRNNVIEARIDFADQFLDQASLSGGRPSFQQNKDRNLFFTHVLQHTKEPASVFPDFSVQLIFVFRFGFLNIFQHFEAPSMQLSGFSLLYRKSVRGSSI